MSRSRRVGYVSLGFLCVLSGVLVGCQKKKVVGPPAPQSKSAVLSLSPQTGSFGVGEEVSLSLELDGGGHPVDAFDVEIAYDPQLVQVINLDPEKDAFAQYPITDTQNGKIRLAGLAAAGPTGPQAYTGSGPVAVIRLKFAQAGQKVGLTFSDKSIVASKGENVLKEAVSGEYQVNP